MADIGSDFFLRAPTEVAKDLLGMTLLTTVRGKTVGGIIVETEAYGSVGDEASHSHRGITKRNAVMFDEGGSCYVYLIYGVHYCVNVVTEEKGKGSAVLIRAVQPTVGIELMAKRRGIRSIKKEISNGPGKLCEALSITPRMGGENLLTSDLIRIERGVRFKDQDIASSKRIGISKSMNLDWRFYILGNSWVSR